MSRRFLRPKIFLMPFSTSRKRGREKETLRRLYLALHHHNPTTRDPSTVSYSILLMEKSPSPDATSCTRYRVTMEASLTDDIGLLEWVFSVESGLSTRAVRPLALLLLGKILPEVTAQEIELVLRSVPVVQADLVWSSSPWMLGALRVSLVLFPFPNQSSSGQFDMLRTCLLVCSSRAVTPRGGLRSHRCRTFCAS